jgi:hypothetical protein
MDCGDTFKQHLLELQFGWFKSVLAVLSISESSDTVSVKALPRKVAIINNAKYKKEANKKEAMNR